jgi:hypothetical protein
MFYIFVDIDYIDRNTLKSDIKEESIHAGYWSVVLCLRNRNGNECH